MIQYGKTILELIIVHELLIWRRMIIFLVSIPINVEQKHYMNK